MKYLSKTLVFLAENSYNAFLSPSMEERLSNER